MQYLRSVLDAVPTSVWYGLLFSILFIWLRLFALESSYLFFNDQGRDLYVLQQWLETNKPPLLGPQTSALPFNQSAAYFYLLMPIYLLSGKALISPILTVMVIHIAVFWSGIYYFRHAKTWIFPWLVSWTVYGFHFEVVRQHRYVWNPSLVGVCLLVGMFAWLQLTKRWNKKNVWLTSLSLAGAVSFSYSAAPVLLVVLGLSLVLWRHSLWKWVRLLGATIVSGAIWNMPTAVFELRHSFLLTNMLMYQEKLEQIDSIFSTKAARLTTLIMGSPGKGLVLVGLLVMLIFFKLSDKSWHIQVRDKTQPAILIFAALLGSALLTLILPVSLHEHYIFGILSLLAILVAFLPSRQAVLMGVVCICIWGQSGVFHSMFVPVARSINQSLACAQRICTDIDQPVFASVQAGMHPYHNAYEWRYLLGEAGCDVKDIATEPTSAQQMIVVLDQSGYEHEVTAYNELTQFGASQVVGEVECGEKFGGVVLERTSI